jgi:D-alanyl-D-alanine carboxypeptidase (penicillin-binding protein 5/6)
MLRLLIINFIVLFLCSTPLFSQAETFEPPDTGIRINLNFNTPPLLLPYTEAAPEINSRAALLLDAETGTVLYAKNHNDEIPPASLTKLMTMHLVLKEVDAGRASLDDIVPIGEESWALRQPPRSSLMFLAPGQTVTLREIMLGLAVSSGKDAAVAAALYLTPSVSDFAHMMTTEARSMGFIKTRFTEPSGISENNITTAAEFAAFCREYIRLHPQVLSEFHSVLEFAYPRANNVSAAYQSRPNTIVQTNSNTLLKTFPGVDGLKTGYIDEAGYNIALTAQRDGTRYITVILGAPASRGGNYIRDRDGERLLSWAFGNFKTVHPSTEPIKPVRLWKGKDKFAELQIAAPTTENEPLIFTAPIDRATSLIIKDEIVSPLIAPLPASFPVGWLVISDEQGELHRVQLLTAREYPQGNFFKRLWDSIRLFFLKK